MMNSKYVALSNAMPRNLNTATHPPPVQSYSVNVFGPFFTWVYHAADAAVMSLDNFDKMDTPLTMNRPRFCRVCTSHRSYDGSPPTCRDQKKNIKEIQDQASAYQKQQWINWHWGAAPDSVIHPP